MHIRHTAARPYKSVSKRRTARATVRGRVIVERRVKSWPIDEKSMRAFHRRRFFCELCCGLRLPFSLKEAVRDSSSSSDSSWALVRSSFRWSAFGCCGCRLGECVGACTCCGCNDCALSFFENRCSSTLSVAECGTNFAPSPSRSGLGAKTAVVADVSAASPCATLPPLLDSQPATMDDALEMCTMLIDGLYETVRLLWNLY